MYEEALPIFRNALHYKNLAKDSTTLMFPMRDIARIYDTIEKRDSAIIYYNKALKAAKRTNDKIKTLKIQSEMSWIYIDVNMYKEAFQNLHPSLNNTFDKESYVTYLGLGIIHLKTNNLDSAAFYLKKAANSKNLYTVRDVYNSLSKLEETKKNYLEAIKYARKSEQSTNLIQRSSASSEIRKVRSLYNYQKKEKENQQLKLVNTKKQLYISQLALLIALITFAFAGIAFYWWKKKNQSIEQALKLQKEKESQYKQSMEYLKENAEKLKHMESDLSQIKKQNNTAQKDLIKTQKLLLEKTNQQILLHHEKIHILQSDFNSSAIYLKFHTSINIEAIKITDDDWELLQREINITYEGFIAKLYGFNPKISQMDLRICLLIKIAIKVSRMAIFLNRSKSSISSSRSRLHKKLTGRDGTPDDLDELIKGM